MRFWFVVGSLLQDNLLLQLAKNHVQPLVECHSPRIELSPASLMLLGSLGCTMERLGHIAQIHLPFQVFGVG